MSRDYAKRSRVSSTATSKNKREPARFTRAKQAPVRVSSKTTMQARRIKRKPTKTKRVRRFPIKQFLFLCVLLAFVVVVIMLVRTFSDKINQRLHPRAPVIEAVPVSLAPTPHPEQVVVQKPTFVFKPAELTGSEKLGYVLQLGTYMQTDTLELLKSNLHKLNIAFKSVPIMRAQAQYYRLTVGPFKDEASALKVQLILRQHRIFAVVLKVR